jgi:hypothetical protein
MSNSAEREDMLDIPLYIPTDLNVIKIQVEILG